MVGSTALQPNSGRRYALCVGIGTYSDPKIRNLSHAVNDAEAIAKVFSDPVRGNFAVTPLITEEQTTRDALVTELQNIGNSDDPKTDDLVVIYISCHGEVYGTNKTFCLLPSNAAIKKHKDVDYTKVIDIYDLARWLSNANVKNIVMLLDVCYSGGVGDALQYLRQSLSPDNSIYLIAAARRDQIAAQSDKLQHGIFTDALLQAFRQKPNRSDGWLTITQIGSFVEDAAKSYPSFEHGFFISAHAASSNLPIVKNPLYSKESEDFFKQVRQLLEVIHYEKVETGIPREAPAGFWVAEVQGSLGIQRVGVIPRYNKIEDLTLEEVRMIVSFVKEKIEQEDLDQGLLVLAQEVVSRDVKGVVREYSSSRRMMIRTVGHIRRNFVNFSRYLRLLIERYEKPDPGQPDGPPPMMEIYVPLETKQGDVEKEVKHWLSDPTSTRCALLGDYGCGKSTFCQHLAAVLAKECQDEQDDPSSSTRIPLIIPLGDFGRSFDLEAHLVSHLRKYRVEITDIDALMKMAEAGLLLFLFDGFDEMASRATTDILKRNIDQIEIWAQVERNKVLVTTRPEYFMNLREEQELLKNHHRLELQLFNETQFDLYLQKRVRFLKVGEDEAIQDWKYYRQQINRIYNLTDLTRRPVLLEMIIKTFPTLIAKGRAVNRPDLYREYLQEELERQNRKSGRCLSIGREQRFEIMGQVALDLYRTERTELSSAEIEIIAYDLLTREQQKDIKGFLREFVSCSFLIRRGDTYRFSHESFLEYLVAYQLAKDIKNKTQKHFQLKLISKTIREFLLEIIEPEGIREIETTHEKGAIASEYVNELERWFREKSQESPTSANVISLLARILPHEQLYKLPLQEANLTGVDLSEAQLQKAPLDKARLEGAKLSEAYLEGADLRWAHLEGANLNGAHLEGANLNGGYLKRARLIGVHLTGAYLMSTNLEGANLKGAHLSGTRLEGSNLKTTNLEGADLKGANLFGAHLEGADLKGANLLGTHLEGADLKGATNLEGTGLANE